MKKLKYILQHRYFIKIITIFILIFTIINNQILKKESIYNVDETKFSGIIYKKKLKMTK